MIRRPPRSTQSRSSAASDVYKRQTVRPTRSWAAGGRLTIPPTAVGPATTWTATPPAGAPPVAGTVSISVPPTVTAPTAVVDPTGATRTSPGAYSSDTVGATRRSSAGAGVSAGWWHA